MDLFVRVSNQVAVNMYKRLGYSVYRTVIEYYSASNGEPDEDAYGESAMLFLIFCDYIRHQRFWSRAAPPHSNVGEVVDV